MKLLHIIATPREEESRTLKMSDAFFENFREKNPGCMIDTLDLFQEALPPLGMKRIGGKYVLLAGKDLYGELKEAWEEILQHIERFLSADLYVISTPMWNFNIPYLLKQYIDIIVQPRYLFRFTEKGVEGLAKNKKMLVITSRGGDYTSDQKSLDLQEPYLRTIFGFVGIQDITFLKAEPMDRDKEVQKKKLQEGIETARRLGLEWRKNA